MFVTVHVVERGYHVKSTLYVYTTRTLNVWMGLVVKDQNQFDGLI